MGSNAAVRVIGRLFSTKLTLKPMSTSLSAGIFASLSTMAPVKPIRPLVICGPSGVGKSTIVNNLLKEFPNVFGFSVSHTTRKPREGEQVRSMSFLFSAKFFVMTYLGLKLQCFCC